jgi:DSC E3 ubiquitin ligase complex subunit 3, ubiquitin-like domain/DSC E3 ubiquitin ligase complex subunit 3, C-terminal domain
MNNEPGPSNGQYLPPPPSVPFYLTIRFSSSALPDLELAIENVNATPVPTVAHLKHQIRVLRPEDTRNRRLRLILAGRILHDHVQLKTLRTQHFLHVPVPSVKGKEKETLPRLWIHCSMGELLSDEEFMEEDGEKQVQSTIPLPAGFDRLRSAGFTDDEIVSLREQFQRFHGSRIGGEDGVDGTAMEERWLDEAIALGTAGHVDGDVIVELTNCRAVGFV